MIFLPNVRYAEVCSLLPLIFFISTSATAEPLASREPLEINSLLNNYSLSLRIESEWAILSNDGNTQKLQLMVEPELEIDITERSRITTIARLRTDAKDNISPGDHNQSELRELYLDTTFSGSIITLGKQQVVWGKSDGLKVLDIINPQDFREFILDDFDQSRIPLWTANAEIAIKDVTVQLLLIPDLTYHKFASTGSSYQFSSPLIIPPMPSDANVIVNVTQTPDNLLHDADIGFRLSTFTYGWDLTFNYFYHYDDSPVLFRTISPSINGLNISINPQFKRTHLIGASFSNTFGNLTLRGEAGYLTDKYISTSNPFDKDGIIKTGELRYVLGFDWYSFSDNLLSVQVFQTYLDNHQTGMIRDRLNTQLTFLIKQDFMHETLHGEILVLQDLDYKDGMVRPKLTYEYSDEVNVYIGADIFYGSKEGIFGQFKEENRFISGLIIGF